MNKIYNEYLVNMRNLVSVYLVNYKNKDFDDEYKEANEFLLNYTFGKNRGTRILQLEQNYTTSLENIIKNPHVNGN
jgi:hypothetical protein